MTFELGPNISVGIQNPILTFELRLNIVFQHLKSYFDIGKGAVYRILTFLSKSYFHIQIEAEYRIVTFIILFDIRTWAKYRNLTLKILFPHSKSGGISYFDILNPILTLELGRMLYFDIQNPILTFEIWANIVF